MSPTELTGLVMAIAAIFGVAFQFFANRKAAAKITAGTEATSWGELVASLQAEIDRQHRECSEEVAALKAEHQGQITRLRNRIKELERMYLNATLAAETRRLNEDLGG
ncbi:MAG: hypothetical protein M3O28_00815 [Actinomycetota bacterium]|nr:hypothetical protein [Actinomycetota bacterium]